MTLRRTKPIGDRRRGACMVVLDASHSDIYDFVTIKAERRGELSYFNLSLGVTDAFLHAAERTGAHHLMLSYAAPQPPLTQAETEICGRCAGRSYEL
jgi:ribonucleotide reductase alpha subunit